MAVQFKSIVLGFTVPLLLAGGVALAYAQWTEPIKDADAEVAAAQYQPALANYQVAESRFNQMAPLKQAFPAEYNRVVANQLWLLYRLGRYDETIDKAEHAPDNSMPHFWAGLALYRKSEAEKKPDVKLQLVSSAQQELYSAVEAAPDDLDTKYNFEVVTRLQNSLHPPPKAAPDQKEDENLHLTSPVQPKEPPKPVKPGG